MPPFAKPLPQDECDQLARLFNSGRHAELEARTRLLIEQYPDSGFAWKVLSVALQLQGKEALPVLQKAVELLPGDAEVHNNLGLALNGPERRNDAVACFRRAVAINPAYADAYCNLGAALKELGQLDEAAASFRRALEIKPDFPDVRINLGITLHSIVGKNSGKIFFDVQKKNFQGVRKQYESLPFPSRDPEAERYVLEVSVPDMLGKVNQYCFAGNRDFTQPFRVLVAGCGTGDSVIWLAHQLQGTPAEIVAIDMSGASLAVAQARAKVRQLTNIRWINGSLLDVASLAPGKFDYITCLGVLHHLPDPVQGLAALESVLAEGGAMAIMLYGANGRSHIYAMQKMLQQLSVGLDEPGERLSFARKIVAGLPATNGFLKKEGAAMIDSQYLQDDTNLWDTLLHEQDRAYTAGEVREFLGSAGLCLQAYISYQGVGAITGLQYDLDSYIDDAAQKQRLGGLPLAERENLAEALDGSLALHTVYATRSAQSSLSPMAPNAILCPLSHSALQILAHLSRSDQALPVVLSSGMTIAYNPSALTRAFLANIDGQRSNAEIARLLGIEDASEDLVRVNQELRIPAALHWLIARTGRGSFVPPLPDRSNLSSPLRHFEPTTLPL
jgi:2-polyprenyl-3-methyl-5-hydroxy-6-metoxy-1,4-benzoquinol methylase